MTERKDTVRPRALVALAALAACSGTSPPRARTVAVPATASAAAPAAPGETLAFEVTEGDIRNYFLRQGRVAAHLLATSGAEPRLIVAFPAGNTGVGLWFARPPRPTELAVDGRVEPVERPDGMRGVTAVVRAAAPNLLINAAVLGSVRTLRDFALTRRTPPQVTNQVISGTPLVVRRTTVDGNHHVEVAIEPLDGATAAPEASGGIALGARPGAEALRVRITALADDPPLTPIPRSELVTAAAADSERDLDALAFLSYREKLLAGSWRFLTYFGRDTLMTVRLLMPVLQPAVVEAALGAVLERVDLTGDVAHEEDIGEFAALRNLAEGGSARPVDLRTPLYDYKMVDDDFLLAPVLAHYLLDTPAGRERGAAFLARRTPAGLTYGDALRRNLSLVVRRATPFARDPRATNLISLREGIPVGQWRDSNEGLGGGRIPFDVNVALVPAALHAAERLYASHLFGADEAAAAGARSLREPWGRAAEFFRVSLPAAVATARLRAYAREQGLDPDAAVAAVIGPVTFPALALDAAGTPVPVMHSDDGFVLLFTDPPPDYLERAAARIGLPFPHGLRTPVGIVVANPAYAPDFSLRALFTRRHYHGTVIWSWQQALLAAGLERQLGRSDLPSTTLAALRQAQALLWDAIRATREARTSELWTFGVDRGRYTMVPFQGGSAVDESNAVQLWSTVYLAVQPPASQPSAVSAAPTAPRALAR